jgi:glycosyltransferase involved in cell wall biosynthesis
MKIGIHNEPRLGAFGGSEVSVAVLAESLAKNHDVEILHYRPGMTAENLGAFAAVDLTNVRMLLMNRQSGNESVAKTPWGRYRAERMRDIALNKKYDVFITFNHGRPPFCAARRGILVVLFPIDSPFDVPSDARHVSVISNLLRSGPRSVWLKWRLKRQLGGYQARVAISEFTRSWTKRRWRTDTLVIYPPVKVSDKAEEKTNCIIAVGRFAVEGHGHSKHQREMMTTFLQLKRDGFADWQFNCAGACGDSARESSFLAEVKRIAQESGAHVQVNIGRSELDLLYRRAKIFWHAAGMTIDEQQHPELVEHFGITTAEAMANGCVPVVVNKGGQPEIVEHGVSGFLWRTPREWRDYTSLLMADAELLTRMSSAARTRVERFSRKKFVSCFEELLGQDQVQVSDASYARA